MASPSSPNLTTMISRLLFLLHCSSIATIGVEAASSSSLSSLFKFSTWSSSRIVMTTTMTRRLSTAVFILRGGNIDLDKDVNALDEQAQKEEEEVNDDGETDLPLLPPPSSLSASSAIVKLKISTSLRSDILDRTTTLMSSRTRSVLSLRQAVSRTLPGNPPFSAVRLRYRGRLLEDDDMTVEDVLLSRNEDEDDDDDEEEDIFGEQEEEEEDVEKFVLTLDMIPPIDAKFGIQLRDTTLTMSTKEILEAYYLNVAGLAYTQEMQMKEQQQQLQLLHVSGGKEGMEKDDLVNHSLDIRKRASLVQRQFEVLLSDDTRRLIEEEHERVAAVRRRKGGSSNDDDDDDGEETVFGLVPRDGGSSTSSSLSSSLTNSPRTTGSSRSSLKRNRGGATMNVRRILQRNMNIHWSTTTRNAILFLFFGYFGGRNSFSRTLLLLMSPLCFILQTRPIKVVLKQLFYFWGEPPGILLSLLPAPQQAIMSCNYGDTMRKVYGIGEKMLEEWGGEEWLELEQFEAEELARIKERWGSSANRKGVNNFHDEYDQYDEDDDDDDNEDDE